MASYEHTRLVDALTRLDTMPNDPTDFSNWVQAREHLDFLKTNACSEELVLYASPEYSFIYSMVVPNKSLSPVNHDDLLGWSCNPYSSAASFVYGGGRTDVWLERGPSSTGSKALNEGLQLLFGRSFEGWAGSDQTYFELDQGFSHASGIHWRGEHRSYCRFDGNGDLEHVVSVTGPKRGSDGVTLVSCRLQPLEEFLAASESSLVRMFDFTLFRRGGFTNWPPGDEVVIHEHDGFFYRRKISPGVAAYSRGVQIIRPTRARKPQWGRDDSGPFADFIVHDFRHDRIVKVSTDPRATTNYFEAKENDLPFELSPAFFRPEVLLKYKADRDKYTIGDRDIACRAAWYLKAFDVNEAGQIFAYICYLRALPHAEQLHWASFNEAPKAGISARALQTDFKGEFADRQDPLQAILDIAREWHAKKVPWWVLRDPDLLDRISKPVTASRDEWADAFLELSKLVVEGFVLGDLRRRLQAKAVSFDDREQSIALLEKLLGAPAQAVAAMDALRTVQRIRTKVKGHTGGAEAEEIVRSAIQAHGGLPAHFVYVSEALLQELRTIETAMTPATPGSPE